MKKPSPLTRLKAAAQFYRQGWRAFRPVEFERKKAPFAWPTWRQGQPTWQIIDYKNYAAEGFNLNSVIYSAIMYKARSIVAAPLRAYKGTYDEPELLDAAHPLAQLVARPNPYQSWSEFQGLCEVYFNLAGNCYIHVDRAQGEDVPQALYPLRPDRMYIVPGKKTGNVAEMLGYIYVPEGKTRGDSKPFLPEDVMHVKLPNAIDPLEGMGYGLSPVASMARSGDVDNEVSRYLKLFFEKGAMPPGLLQFDVPMTDDDVSRARERWQEIYGGVDNWSDVAVLDQGGKYQRLGLSFDEMGFEPIDERNESRMTGPFGVPPILIGARVGLKHATYSNYGEARKAFWEDTMTPELRWFEAEYRYYLQGEGGEFVAFDLSKVPALQEDAGERATIVDAAFRAGAITRNEYRAVIGQDPVPGGDVYVMPMTMLTWPAGKEPKPQTETGAPEAQEEAEEGKAQTKASAWTTEQKAAFWKQHDAQARAWERKFGDAALAAFEHDRREILALVGEAKAKAQQEKATVGWMQALLPVVSYLRVGANENWRENFAPVLAGIVQARGEQLNAEFGMEFDVRNLLAEDWFDNYVITFAQPINDSTEEAMRKLFQQATAEGWSVPTMTDHLDTMFDQWMHGDVLPEDFEWYADRMPFYRREVIARTESLSASNRGSWELYKGWNAPKKEWLATLDGRVRDTHAAADGQIRLIDEPFDVGGSKMQHPGDKNAPVGEIANCRCAILPILSD